MASRPRGGDLTSRSCPLGVIATFARRRLLVESLIYRVIFTDADVDIGEHITC